MELSERQGARINPVHKWHFKLQVRNEESVIILNASVALFVNTYDFKHNFTSDQTNPIFNTYEFANSLISILSIHFLITVLSWWE